MKICLIGNLNIFIYNFAKYYVEKKGFEVFLISRKKTNYCNKDFGFIKIYYLKSEKLIYKIIKIRQIIKKNNPAVVHCFYVARDAIAPTLFFRRKFKYICSIFGSDFYWGLNSFSKKIIKKITFNKCDIITFNSHQMKKDMMNKFPKLNINKIRPIKFGIDYNLFNKVEQNEIVELKKKINITDEKIILSFRGFKDVYNQKIIIKTIPQIVKYNNNVRFIFILGNTKLTDINEFIAFLKEKKVYENTIFIENFISSNELSLFLNLSDIVINIPTTDQFALSLIETMASHTIPILSDLQVYQENLANHKNAMFLDEISVKNLGSKIKYTLDNYEKISDKIIKANNAIIKKAFDFECQIEKIIALYK